ncbi:MAG: AAA family ATPase [Verrucomicrobiae bacterium]|nr:AAA family ATPase [Verrucomicrobiae bacterium]
MQATTVATINFKGGVGKTTVTWCLANVSAATMNYPTLLFDLDAQMSLTQAVALKPDTGGLTPLGEWYEKAVQNKRTLFHALEIYTSPQKGAYFDFPIKHDFIFHVDGKNLDFIPSSEEFYWFELEVFERDRVKHFIRDLLGKIANAPRMPKYKYVFFDCPPNFSVLSYSTLATCKLILVPVNPDFYAARGLNLILHHLKLRIEPFPLPTVGVFMNKAGWRPNTGLFRETRLYIERCKAVCEEWQTRGARVFWLNTFIPDRVDVKRAIHYGGWAQRYTGDFEKLFKEIETIV